MHAGFWKRFAAYIIDRVAITIIGFGIGVIIGLFLCITSPAFMDVIDTTQPFFTLLGIAIAWLYFALFESSALQATPGKLALGVKVTDLNGNRIGFGRATARYFSKIVSAIVACIGFVMIGLTDKKQGLHDLMAGTLVVNRNAPVAKPEEM